MIKTGVDIVRKKNGHEALEYIKSVEHSLPELILMDVLIPFVNGIDVTRDIRKLQVKVPILVITAYNSKEIKEKCYLAGCNDFLVKPVLPERLLRVIAEYFHEPEKVKIQI